MPSPSDFKKAFNLNKGATLHSSQGKNKTLLAEVSKASIGHTVKKQNELYKFPSTLDVEIKDKTITRHNLEAAVKEFLAESSQTKKTKQKKEVLVCSAYGSPYSCYITNIKIKSFDPYKSHARITFLGKAVRRRDIPTLGQQKEEERKKSMTAAKKRKHEVLPIKDIEISKEDEKEWLLPQMRVIKSRFGSSKCTLCGERIDPGTKIAKDASSTERGGWMHASCAVEHAKTKKKPSSRALAEKSKRRPS